MAPATVFRTGPNDVEKRLNFPSSESITTIQTITWGRPPRTLLVCHLPSRSATRARLSRQAVWAERSRDQGLAGDRAADPGPLERLLAGPRRRSLAE